LEGQVSDGIQEARTAIARRIKELRDEEKRLTRALEALADLDGKKPAAGKRVRGGREPRVDRRKPTRGRKRAPRGQRQAEFLTAVRKTPEQPVAQIAREMGVQPQQLYAIARKLRADGKVKRRGRGYVVVG
jgi:predicted Rossmann fold nucleotide-binding protein DprA/Smf involved in DNA uptake